MQFSIVSLFPEIFQSYFSYGVVGRAIKNNSVSVSYYNIRDYSNDKHGTVDDKPFGGGSGMLLRPEPLSRAIEQSIEDININAHKTKSNNSPQVIYLSPQGKPITQSIINDHAQSKNPLVLISGRYEGIDQRIIDKYVDIEYSIGDYVLSGGELPSLVLMDGIIRRLPGVLGDDHSSIEESFGVTSVNSVNNQFNMLEYPQYTRPCSFMGMQVPEVLLSGNHSKILRWRLKQTLGKTWLRRPNLLKCNDLTQEQRELLEEFKQELG